MSFVVFIGLLRCIGICIALLKSCIRHCFRPKQNLFKRYGGKGTWALVTGASSGLGAEYCKQLAKDGFNICLISRTQYKLKAVEKEVKKIAPGVKTRII